MVNNTGSMIIDTSIKSNDIWYQAIVYSITIPLFILTAAGATIILVFCPFILKY